MTTQVQAIPMDMEDDEGTYQAFVWDCPQCGNMNESSGDDFEQKNGRWQSRYLHYCEFCDEDEVLLYKK